METPFFNPVNENISNNLCHFFCKNLVISAPSGIFVLHLIKTFLYQIKDLVAQLVEHLTFNQRVMGSNPIEITNKKHGLRAFCIYGRALLRHRTYAPFPNFIGLFNPTKVIPRAFN